jgi:alginate O-acetyltransferase complex protein AlgI
MVLSSFLFLSGFLPAFLAVYFLAPDRRKNAVALGASLCFYAWGAPTMVVYLVAACALDFAAA